MIDSSSAASEPIAWLSGKWLPLSQIGVGVFDAGFMQGATVPEQLRTFGGRLFQLDRHLDRLARSLAIVGINPGLRRDELAAIATDVAARNHLRLTAGDDLGLTIFVTPGTSGPFEAYASHRGPTVCIHAQPLPFGQWADKYRAGESLVVTDIEQVPPSCWPAELKCRSRMHYYLADKRAREIEPGARALLLDGQGHVTEASTANVLAYFAGEGLVSPPPEKILPGVTLSVLHDLAVQLGIPFLHRDLFIDELAQADEVLLASTSPCVWPVTRVNQQPIASGRPGPVVARLHAEWRDLVGIDIVEQAQRFAKRVL
jgi:branched-subunit amino acid aminotransferase/4-amino-4-deoxychorismate lyase